MKKSKVFLIGVCLGLTCMVAKAQSPVTYTGNQLPTAAGWSEQKMDNTVNTEAGAPVTAEIQENVLKLSTVSNGGYNQLGWYKTNVGFNASVGYTVEIKAKVTTADGSFNISGFDGAGRGFRLIINPDKLIESTGGLLLNTLSDDANNDAFHTYRIAVVPDGIVHVYRDGAKIGEFEHSAWGGDNLITDGGFESGRSFAQLGWEQNVDGAGMLNVSDDPNYIHSGSKGLFVDKARHTYRSIPLKDGSVEYSMSYYGKTIKYGDEEWRDINGWLDPAGHRIFCGVMDKNNPNWVHYNFSWTGGGAAKVFNTELWVNTADGRNGNQSAYDDFLFTERFAHSIMPKGAVNLFPNGTVEDPHFDYFPAGDARNDTSIVFDRDDNEAPFWHPFWGARVRMQYGIQGNNESGPFYSRSGKYALRYYTCGQEPETYYGDPHYNDNPNDQTERRGANSPLNCRMELQPNKTYTFSFWYHTANWPDNIDLALENGSVQLWQQNINNSSFPQWHNKTVTFTTTAEDHTLIFRTVRTGHCVIYFDDFLLFEGEPAQYDNTGLFFGKPAGTEGVGVEIESVSYDNTGAYDPEGNMIDAEYIKKTAPLMTTWGENLDLNKLPFNEYPRPQLERNSWVNLNGIWKFTRNNTKAGFGTYNADATYRQSILVPYPIESALSGIMDSDYNNMNKTYAYRRTFTVDADAGKRVILHFGAVDWECYVFVNGTQVAHHLGGYDSFSADITGALNESGEQELVVQIYDPTKGGNPRGKQDPEPGGIWYTPSSGIWQTVWYEVVDPVYISNLVITPSVDAKAVRVNVNVSGASSGIKARVTVMDGETAVGTAQTVDVNKEVSIPVSNPKLWSPDSPFLYGLKIELVNGETVTDEVSSYFGMRKISKGQLRGKPYMFLNNEPIFHYGTLDQGFWPDGLHTPPSYDALRFDLLETKNLGMNMVRKHIKVEPARWFYYCDSIGLMVWQDMPTPAGLLDTRVVGDGSDNAVKQNFLRETEALVKSLYNYPSIVMWVPYNEGWAQFAGSDDPAKGDPSHTIAGVNLIRSLDKTRLINPASGWTSYEIGDILDRHNYSEPALHNNTYNERVAVCGETGGYGFVIDGHIWSVAGNPYTSVTSAAELAEKYRLFNQRAIDLSLAGINGIVYTQFSDIEEEVNGFYTYDRKVNKLALDGGVAGEVLMEGIEKMKTAVLAPLLKINDQGGDVWKYITYDNPSTTPAEGWNTSKAFDDSSWAEGKTRFGDSGNTSWLNAAIYMRKIVEVPNLSDDVKETLVFQMFHDEDVNFYINGVLAYSATGYISAYQTIEITQEAKDAIIWGGENLFAISVMQTSGGQAIDLGWSSIEITNPLDWEPATEPVVWTEVSNAEEFLAMANNLSGFYKLTADIDISIIETYVPIGTTANPFTGYLHGDQHTVFCPSISGTDRVGLFGYAKGACFTDLVLDGAEVSGNADVGVLLGKGVGVTIERVVIDEKGEFQTKVTGIDHVGAIAGGTDSGKGSRIKDCYVVDAEIISSDWQAGGLVGVGSDLRIENSYFTGTVNVVNEAGSDNADGSGIVSRLENGINSMRGVVSLATEVKSGSSNQFISYGSAGVRLNEFVNCYTRNDMILSDYINANRENLLPRATDAQKRPLADFKTDALYKSIGWDFTNLWIIPQGGGFPVFRDNYVVGVSSPKAQKLSNLKIYKSNSALVLEATQPTAVWIYSISGALIERADIEGTEYFNLPAGVYIIKSACNGNVEAERALN